MKLEQHQGERRGSITALVAGLFLTNGVLLAPVWAAEGALGAPWLALEAPVVVGAFLLLPRRAVTSWLAGGVAIAITAIGVVGLADAAARQSLARPLNLYLDVGLASSVVHLLVGTLGGLRAALLAALFAVTLVVLAVGLTWLLARIPVRSGTTLPQLRPRSLLGIAVVALPIVFWATTGSDAAGDDGAAPPTVVDRLRSLSATPALDLVVEQRRIVARMLNEREGFAAHAATLPSSYRGTPGLLETLGGREVILAFVESYGMTAVEDSRYAPVVLPRLRAMEGRLEAAGLHVASGRLVAPSQGGQSWFGRGTLHSGLWLGNQLRYDLMLAGSRETLIDDFRAAGYSTAAVMPAITMAWPEGERFGYDRIFAHRDMEYEGPPINWVTKPDEYTWCFFERVVRPMGEDRPLFTEIALISSHAPWVPILPVLGDCDAVGDGSVYHRWMEGSERPQDLWRDTDRVRDHYAMAVEYALHAAFRFAERDLGSDALLIVMGDHQPAPLITGDTSNWSVPVHVVTGQRQLLTPFLDWGFVPGTVPPLESEGVRQEEDLGMDYFRHWFVPAFSQPTQSSP